MKNIILIGMPGCGKTTFGQLLADDLNMPFYDADEILEKREGKTIKELFAVSEEAFRDAESRTVEYLVKFDGAVIATGGGVVLRSKNMELLKQNGVIVFIDRKPSNIISCINSQVRPLLADDRMKLFDLYNQRIELYKQYADYIIGNNGSSAETLTKLKAYAMEVRQ